MKKHLVAFVGALLVALFCYTPYAVFFNTVGDNFQGLWPVLNGDTLYYQTRIQEVRDGYPDINQPYAAETKNIPYPQATFGERFMALVVGLLGVSVPDFQIIADVLFPVIIFLLTYAFLYVLAPRAWPAVFLPVVFYTVVMGGIFKPVHPQISLPLLLVFLICWTCLALKKSTPWVWTVGAGVSLGLLFLIYFFHWSFIIVVAGVHTLILLARKEYSLFKYYAVALVVALVIGIPYFLLVAQGTNAPFHAETAVRVGLYYSHLPETLPRTAVACAWLLFFGWVVWRYKKLNDPRTHVVASLLVANIVYPNNQIITGIIIQNANHWSWMPILLYSIAAHYLWDVLRDSMASTNNSALVSVRRAYTVGTLVMLGVLLVVPAYRLTTFGVPPWRMLGAPTPEYTFQHVVPILEWIKNVSATTSTVIYADRKVTPYITAYTAADVYFSDYSFNVPGSDREVVERALLSHFFEPDFFKDDTFGMTEDARILWTQPAQTERTTHTLHRLMGLSYVQRYSLEKERAYVAGVYNELRALGWNLDLLKRYKIDYIVWNEEQYPQWNLSSYKGLEKVYQSDVFSVWKLKI